MSHERYDELLKILKKAGLLSSVAGVLSWDQQTMMPEGENAIRGTQLGLLSQLVHETFTQERVGELLTELETSELDPVQAAQVRETRHDYDMAVKIPAELVRESTELEVQSDMAWREARAKNDYSMFRPFLEKNIELAKRKAAAIDPSKDPYTVLLSAFESGMTRDDVDAHFAELKRGLVPLIEEVKKKAQPDSSILNRELSEETQMRFNKRLAGMIGYDFSKGRLDLAAHPFTGAYGRITTRFTGDTWLEAILSTIHEAGHAMYEHNLPMEHFGTPLCEARSYSVHESQSRFWENHAGRSREFMEFLLSDDSKEGLRQEYGLEGVTPDELYRVANTARPSLIRVNADELTYTMHVLLRYEMEQEMICGNPDMEKLPALWNQKMQDYLGITPPTDSDGILQDVHWAWGCIGYFPTYTLGSMMSAQLYDAMRRDIPQIEENIRKGDFGQMQDWLKERIHSKGRMHSTKELIRLATGEEPRPKKYLEYLTEKFTKLYKL